MTYRLFTIIRNARKKLVYTENEKKDHFIHGFFFIWSIENKLREANEKTEEYYPPWHPSLLSF